MVNAAIVESFYLQQTSPISESLDIPYPKTEVVVDIPNIVIVDSSMLNPSSDDKTCDGMPGNTMGDVTRAIEIATVHQVTGGDTSTHSGCSLDGNSIVSLPDVMRNYRLANGQSSEDVFNGLALNLSGLNYNNRLFILQLLQGDISDIDSVLVSYRYHGSLVGAFYKCKQQSEIIAKSAAFSSCTIYTIDSFNAQITAAAFGLDREGINDTRLAIQKALADQTFRLTDEAVGDSDHKMYSTILKAVDINTLYFIPNLQRHLPDRLGKYMQGLIDKKLIGGVDDYFNYLWFAVFQQAYI